MVKISVITAAYNGAAYIAEAIDSVLAQTHPDWEQIIVDDGSTDDTVAIAGRYASQYPRIRLVRQENRGAAAARNSGLAMISADSALVTFLDQDDRWAPNALTDMIDALERAPESPAR